MRMPERNIPQQVTSFVSPANGKIVGIKRWNSESFTEPKGDWGAIPVWASDVDTAGTVISIQMNVANVHYQRMPVNGKLIAKKHVPGLFNNAVQMHNELGIRFENEHNWMLFENTDGKRFKLIQIAGFVARRIEDYVEPNQPLAKGDVIGLIKLGSQVTVLLPHGVDVKAAVGDIVIDGETVLAEMP